MNDGSRRRADRDSTRPQDWAPPARVYLFGLDSLTADEFAIEGTRMSGGRAKYGAAVFRAAAAAQRERQQR